MRSAPASAAATSSAGTARPREPRAFCPSCRALVGVAVSTEFPFDRENQDGLFAYAWETFKREWLMLTLATLVFFGVLFGVSMVGQIFQIAHRAIRDTGSGGARAVMVLAVIMIVSTTVQNLVQGVLTMGLVRVSQDALEGKSVDLATLFSQLRKLGRYLVAMVIQMLAFAPVAAVGISLVGWSNLGVFFDPPRTFAQGQNPFEALPSAPVIAAFAVYAAAWAIALLPLFFTVYELALNDRATAWVAVRNSWKIGSGKRLTIFGWALVSGLVMVAGMMCCGVGLLPAYGLGHLVLTGAYLALRKGVELEQ